MITDQIRERVNDREERLLRIDQKAVEVLSAADAARAYWKEQGGSLLLQQALSGEDTVSAIKQDLVKKQGAAEDAGLLLTAVNSELQHLERVRKALETYDQVKLIIARLQEHPDVTRPLIHTETFHRYGREVRNAKRLLDGFSRLLPDEAIDELLARERAVLDGFEQDISDRIEGYEQTAAQIL